MNTIIEFIGLAMLIGAILGTALSLARKEKSPKWAKTLLIAAFPMLLFGLSFTIIPTGYTGVASTFGQINPNPLPNGFNWKIPIIQSIERVNNKQQDQSYPSKVWSETKEQTVLFMEDITITFQINPEKSAWIFANVTDYTNNLVSPTLVASALKEASRTITTEQATNRGVIEPAATESIQKALDDKYGADTVRVLKVVISNMDFEDSYNAAINERQIAKLAQEKQEIENQTNIDKAAAEAEAARMTAQGAADAALIEAQAKADANRIVSESITDKTQKQDAIDRWDGTLPKYVTGTNGTFGILEAAE